jgi:hypothetical protein
MGLHPHLQVRDPGRAAWSKAMGATGAMALLPLLEGADSEAVGTEFGQKVADANTDAAAMAPVAGADMDAVAVDPAAVVDLDVAGMGPVADADMALAADVVMGPVVDADMALAVDVVMGPVVDADMALAADVVMDPEADADLAAVAHEALVSPPRFSVWLTSITTANCPMTRQRFFPPSMKRSSRPLMSTTTVS